MNEEKAKYWSKEILKTIHRCRAMRDKYDEDGRVLRKAPAVKLQEDSASFMTGLGMVENDLVGWDFPEKIKSFGLELEATKVPTYRAKTDKGYRVRIKPQFMKSMESKVEETVEMRKEDDAVKVIQETFGDAKVIPKGKPL